MEEEIEGVVPVAVLDKQYGGSHYKILAIQPVELINKISANFFQGNVIKYITSHRAKNGVKDLQKAKHYIEMINEFNPGKVYVNEEYVREALESYMSVNDLTVDEKDVLRMILLGGDIDEALKLMDVIISDAMDQVERIAGYVNEAIGTLPPKKVINNEEKDLTIIVDPIKLPKGATLDKLKEVKRNIIENAEQLVVYNNIEE